MGDPKKLGSLGARTIGLLHVDDPVLRSVWVWRWERSSNRESALNTIPPLRKTLPQSPERWLPQRRRGGFVDRLLNIIPSNPVAGTFGWPGAAHHFLLVDDRNWDFICWKSS